MRIVHLGSVFVKLWGSHQQRGLVLQRVYFWTSWLGRVCGKAVGGVAGWAWVREVITKLEREAVLARS